MLTALERRRIRIANDYASMENIRRDWLTWTVIGGIAPHAEAYEIAIRVRTVIGPKPTYRDQHVVQLRLPVDYPVAPPVAQMLTTPPPFHPNWYSHGRWCFGDWDGQQESLGEFTVRLIQTLQYNIQITNVRSSANATAGEWYLNNQNRALFPCDRTPLPDPTTRSAAQASPKTSVFKITKT